MIGAVGLVQVIPVVLLFVPVGTLVDRHDRRTLATLAAHGRGRDRYRARARVVLGAPIAVYLALLLALRLRRGGARAVRACR